MTAIDGFQQGAAMALKYGLGIGGTIVVTLGMLIVGRFIVIIMLNCLGDFFE